MKFWTEATPLAKLRLIAFLVVGLMAVHAGFLVYSLYRSEELLARADAVTSVLDEEARAASRRPLLWMLGGVPFGLLLAALALAQVRRIGERTSASPAWPGGWWRAMSSLPRWIPPTAMSLWRWSAR